MTQEKLVRVEERQSSIHLLQQKNSNSSLPDRMPSDIKKILFPLSKFNDKTNTPNAQRTEAMKSEESQEKSSSSSVDAKE